LFEFLSKSFVLPIYERDKSRQTGDNRTMPSRPLGDAPNLSLPFDCSAVLDATIDALLVHDEEGRVVFLNQCACVMFGYDRNEFSVLTVADLSANVRPYTQVEATQRAQIAVENGHHEFLWHSRRKNGELFWSEISLRLHRQNGLPYIIAIVRDITARKHIEDALRESEEKLSKIFHGSSNAMLVTELESGRIVDVNKAWVAASGIPRESALGRTALDLGLWLNPAERVSCLRELEQKGHVRRHEVCLSMAKGPQPTLVSAETLSLSSGTAVLWELYDVSALRLSEAATRERENRLQAISENFDQGMFYQLVSNKDGDRRFTYVSDSVRQLYGATPDEILADPTLVFRHHHPEDVARLAQAEAEAFEKLTTFRAQLRIFELSGKIRWSSVVATPKPQPDGSVVWDGVELIITDLKQAEEDRANLEKQLHHAQRMESVGRLAGGVAHDFNNMLSVIIGQVELALDDLPQDHLLRLNLKEIEKAAHRSKELSRQLLAFARKQTTTPRVINLDTAVTTTMNLLQRLTSENIRLVRRPVENSLWQVRMDSSQLDQILTNLCVNACDAIADTGIVTIETANHTFSNTDNPVRSDLPPGDYVRLSVTDNGCGMNQETQSQIFEPFFTTKPLGKGTGLGLSTVYGIVQQNGGAITVDSELGKGTTFSIYLPRHHGDEGTQLNVEPSIKPCIGNETVLLVEDEPTLLSMISRLLERYGYNVLATSDPEHAIHLAEDHSASIRLLISDVIMPGMNGRTLADRIEAVLPEVPRLFISGYTANVLDDQYRLSSRVGFLQKPFAVTELTKLARELIDTAQRSSDN
jgi:PAS domain S-box-containing protein